MGTLTRIWVEAIFSSMRKSNPIRLLLQALALAAVGFAMSAGSAFAHGGGAAPHDRPQAHATATHADHQRGGAGDAVSYVDLVQKDSAGVSSGPCSGETSRHMAGESCCSIACHAALTVPPVDSLGACDLPGACIGLADLLQGRSSDRTERPPKLS